jgi:hypothetical protein
MKEVGKSVEKIEEKLGMLRRMWGVCWWWAKRRRGPKRGCAEPKKF